jgi:hypothetical protein
VLQQDNDKAHIPAPACIRRWNRQQGDSISLLPSWPSNSPDLSPIENLWSWVQRRVDANGCKTFKEFKATVHEEWKNVTTEMTSKLIQSMGRRLKSCIKKEGNMTKY